MREKLKIFLGKHPNLFAGLSWVLNFLVIFYFGYISWWASVDFNGFASMLFGIPILFILLVFAYLAGANSERNSRVGRVPKNVSQITCILLILFYLTGCFQSLQRITDLPIKIMTRLSKICTGKTPDQWVRPVINHT